MKWFVVPAAVAVALAFANPASAQCGRACQQQYVAPVVQQYAAPVVQQYAVPFVQTIAVPYAVPSAPLAFVQPFAIQTYAAPQKVQAFKAQPVIQKVVQPANVQNFRGLINFGGRRR
jgi:hypothetical protein